ncbi:MAG: ZIP family metal transporter [Chloroflexi bacterium]|nr:ZIP family metal transporter [Chloroflexota bacterium]
MATTNPAAEVPAPRYSTILIGVLPLLALALVLGLFIIGDPTAIFTGDAPPVEELQTQRVSLDDQGFLVEIINSGPDPVTLAQVTVDDAYWAFEFERGDRQLSRLETAALRIPYPWVEGEAHEIKLLTSTGLAFSVPVEVAIKTPVADGDQFLAYGLLGIYVGVVPVALGLLWYPFMRRISRQWMNFALALTVGLLIFLLADTLLEALEIAPQVPGIFQGESLVILITLLTFLAIVAIGRNANRNESRLYLAYMIAVGIGFHNLGEGLAVGAAFAVGAASLGTFLVIGFTLHNITEGIGIAAPVVSEQPRLVHFVVLALIAGVPAVIGAWIGGFAFSPLLAVLFLSIGAGAILQVIYEVSRLLVRDAARHHEVALSWLNLAGLVAGIAIMYFTAFFVK